MIGSLDGVSVALVLGAHPDDEMGCAGLVAQLADRGTVVHHHYFAECAISTVARGCAPDQLLAECDRSRAILGISQANCGGFDFPVREFPAHRQQILDALILLRSAIKPDLVLTACRADVHQDHATLTAEAVRAFKFATILGYEMPWNCLEARHDVLVEISEAHLERKIAAIGCYASQAGGAYTDPEFIRGLARVRGVQAGVRYAESYELIRSVVRN